MKIFKVTILDILLLQTMNTRLEQLQLVEKSHEKPQYKCDHLRKSKGHSKSTLHQLWQFLHPFHFFVTLCNFVPKLLK